MRAVFIQIITDPGKKRQHLQKILLSSHKKSCHKSNASRQPSLYLMILLFLFKVTIQQALERSSVSCLILGHLMNRVMDRIQVLLLGHLSQLQLGRR